MIKKFEQYDNKGLEVIDEFIISNIINSNPRFSDIYTNIHNKVVGKIVTFEGGHPSSDEIPIEIKTLINRVEIILHDKMNYIVLFYISGMFLRGQVLAVNATKPIKIWGRRIKSSVDPYGEEDWSDAV